MRKPTRVESALALALLATLAASAACTLPRGAVRGFQTPGGWTSHNAIVDPGVRSDVMFLGASADGQIVVRLADGTVQMWNVE